MAVKCLFFKSPPLFIFLSRLCGGEDADLLESDAGNFLSRLCGGEVVECIGNVDYVFLSRLCGGEEIGRN